MLIWNKVILCGKGEYALRYFNESDISIRQMQCFLAVANQRSFSTAAVTLNMGQSTLSKCISQLERTLGLKLFKRESRPISLTAAGNVLHREWSRLIEEYDASLDNAFGSMKKSRQLLTVGLVDSINTMHFMPTLRKRMLEACPDMELRFEFASFATWRSKLKSGEVDLVLTVLFESRMLDESFRYTRLTTCEKCVCMLPTNPLAEKQRLDFPDLKDQRFLLVAPEESPVYADYVLELCREHGLEPQVAGLIGNANGLFSALTDNDEVIICDRYFRDFHNPLICKKTLPNVTSGMIGVCRTEDRNEYIDAFFSFLRETEGL